MLNTINIQNIISISQKAWKAIMEIYARDFHVEYKWDNSPLTEADLKSNKIINEELLKLYPNIPILSEENKKIPFEKRKNWEYFWLIDPIDGTKEFINKNGEFTVNIALIHKNKPVLWVIYVPVKWTTYYANIGKWVYKIEKEWTEKKIHSIKPTKELLKVVASRSHRWEIMEKYINELEKEYDKIEYIPAGSSLKFCLIAEWKAHIYPRLAPTIEWDTGAGHIIATEAGASIFSYKSSKEFVYNKQNLLNPFFIVKSF